MGTLFKKIKIIMKVMVLRGIVLLSSAAYLLGLVIGIGMQIWNKASDGKENDNGRFNDNRFLR